MALHTFSCSIFKCLLISETSPSLEEEEENSEKADDSDAAVVFDSGLLLREYKILISDALMHASISHLAQKDFTPYSASKHYFFHSQVALY